MPSHVWRQCEGKRRYSEQDARRVANRINAQRTRRESKVEAYPCNCCPDWHVGGSRHNGHRFRSDL